LIFDSDVVIWFMRGHERAETMIRHTDERLLSVVSYMELIQGARDGTDLRYIKHFIAKAHFDIVPLSEDIGQRAAMYLEDHCLSSGLDLGDALIAATAFEKGLPLCTANKKHYRAIPGLELEFFRP
jgi:predicted nucleic acid-binding protein